LQTLSGELNRAFSERLQSSSGYFRAAYFEPTFFKYNNSICNGVQWIRGESNFLAGLRVLITTKTLSPPGAFLWDGSWFGHPGTELIDEYMGTYFVREMIDDGWSAERINMYFAEDVERFTKARSPYLLYSP
jgi:uncharacterized protein YbbC (DUF1343 family)